MLDTDVRKVRKSVQFHNNADGARQLLKSRLKGKVWKNLKVREVTRITNEDATWSIVGDSDGHMIQWYVYPLTCDVEEI